MALSSSKPHSRISSVATIRFFQPNDRAACQKIFVDGSNESAKDNFLFFLTRVTWYFAVGAVPASFTAIIWSPWILAVYFFLAFLFFVCPIIYWLSIYKSWQKSRLNTKFSFSDGGQIWVAELNSKVVGMVRLTPKPDPGVSELQMLYVVPHCRKIGIGKNLLTELTAYAKRKEMEKIMLNTASTTTSAIRLYEKQGFKIVASEKMLGGLISVHTFQMEIEQKCLEVQ